MHLVTTSGLSLVDEGNLLPRLLLAGHVACKFCLLDKFVIREGL